MNEMKTVFISVFQPFISRNILDTGVLDELLSRGARAVLFVPSSKFDSYKERYARENTEVISFDPEKSASGKEKLFQNFAWLLVNTNVKKFQQMKRLLYLKRDPIRYVYQRFVSSVFGRSKYFKNFFRWVEERWNEQDALGEYFEKYHPDAVFAPDVFGAGDVMLLKSAQKRGVKNVGMVLSWDNCTTKGLMRVVPDMLLVQNAIIKEEALSIQVVPEEIIQVVGIAHYDYYKEYKPKSREEFFKEIGVDPKNRLILFSPAGEKFIAYDWQIAEILKRAYAAKKIPDDVVTLIRVHPTNPVEFHDFVPDEHFLIEKPGITFTSVDEKRKELGIEGVHHLLDTLAHADLVINTVSSLVIDAAVLDVPVVTIGFDGFEKNLPFIQSIRRYLADENMAKLLSIGGTPVARSAEETIECVNTYLADKTIDRDGRKNIVEKQCWKLDGKAKERIANAIIGV